MQLPQDGEKTSLLPRFNKIIRSMRLASNADRAKRVRIPSLKLFGRLVAKLASTKRCWRFTSIDQATDDLWDILFESDCGAPPTFAMYFEHDGQVFALLPGVDRIKEQMWTGAAAAQQWPSVRSLYLNVVDLRRFYSKDGVDGPFLQETLRLVQVDFYCRRIRFKSGGLNLFGCEWHDLKFVVEPVFPRSLVCRRPKSPPICYRDLLTKVCSKKTLMFRREMPKGKFLVLWGQSPFLDSFVRRVTEAQGEGFASAPVLDACTTIVCMHTAPNTTNPTKDLVVNNTEQGAKVDAINAATNQREQVDGMSDIFYIVEISNEKQHETLTLCTLPEWRVRRVTRYWVPYYSRHLNRHKKVRQYARYLLPPYSWAATSEEARAIERARSEWFGKSDSALEKLRLFLRTIPGDATMLIRNVLAYKYTTV